ncbi:MAG: hypothetical protein KatS3mg038_1041 [Candidatus Kapaibacterium sp.]|nr:MAG: hypothetical protein KatS3mg038_1041 [Candidatus Kapabacteria bacterium]
MFDDTGQILISLGIDRTALERTLRDLHTLRDSLDSVSASVSDIEEVSYRAADVLQTEVARATEDIYSSVHQVREELNMTRLQRAQRGARTFGTRLMNIGRQLGERLMSLSHYGGFGTFGGYGGYGYTDTDAIGSWFGEISQNFSRLRESVLGMAGAAASAYSGLQSVVGGLTSIVGSAGVAAAALVAVGAVFVAFELHAYNVRKRFEEFTRGIEEEIEARRRLREAQQADVAELQKRINDLTAELEGQLGAARKLIVLSIREELPQYRAEAVNQLASLAHQAAQVAAAQGEDYNRALERFATEAVEKLSGTQVTSILYQMQSKRLGILGTGVGPVGDPTSGASVAAKIYPELQRVVDELGILLQAMEAASARAQRIEAIEQAQRRTALQAEMRDFARTGTAEALRDERTRLREQIAGVQALIKEYEALGVQNQEVAEAVKNANRELAQLVERQEALESIAAPLIEQREREAKAVEALVASIEADAEARRRAADMTSEEIARRRQEINAEIAETARAISLLRLQGAQSEAANAALQEYIQKMAQLRGETERLTRITEPLVMQREREADLRERITNRNTALIQAVMQFDEDMRQIEEQAYKDRAEIQRRYNERLVEIAAEAAKEAADAVKQYQEQLQSLRDEYLRGEAEAEQSYRERVINERIQFQRDEARAYEEHARRLQDILRDAQRREEDLIMARDFAALYQARRDTAYALEDANREFTEQRAERAREYSVRLADEAAQFEKERQQRAAEYAKRLADAQEQFNKERALAEQRRLEAINEARLAQDRERAVLEQNYRQQIELRRQALQRELADIADFGYRKAELERAALERGLQMIGATIDRFTARQIGLMNAELTRMQAAANAIQDQARRAVVQMPSPRARGGTVQYRAGGGAVYHGNLYYVNEPGSSRNEGFNNVPFPPNIGGIFIPLHDGMINGNVASNPRVSGGISLTFNVTAASDPQLTAEAIRRTVIQTVRQLLL